MTPHPTLGSNPHSESGQAGEHLTEEQFGQVLSNFSDPALAAAQAHVLLCNQCATELATLRDSLSLFRQASTVYADRELRHLPPISLTARGMLGPALTPMYWVAAAALLLAAMLPTQSAHRHASPAAPAVSTTRPQSPSVSDEALLEDVDRYTSASIPSPMQALADPTSSSPRINPTDRNPDLKKD